MTADLRVEARGVGLLLAQCRFHRAPRRFHRLQLPDPHPHPQAADNFTPQIFDQSFQGGLTGFEKELHLVYQRIILQFSSSGWLA
jgi:hypothetical protein